MPTISTTARRLRAYQATLDRRVRPARPTTASRRCAPTGDDTWHALLTVLAYYGYHWYPILPYFYTVIGSIDLLTSSDSPVYLHPSAVFFYPVYLTMNYATLRPLLSTCYSKKILSAIFSADPLYCYLSLGDTLLLSIHTHNDTTQRHSYTNLCWTTTTTQLNDTSCLCTTKTFGHYKTSKVEMNATANTTSTMTQAT